jgi:RNA polymerase sigma-70 factor (ECF subfamily)
VVATAEMDYAEIYVQYYEKISRYLAGIVGPLEAQDLAQEVFIKVGNNVDKLKDPAKLSSWIFEIALNTAKDRLRHNSSQKSAGDRLVQLSAEEDQVGTRPDPNVRTPEEILEYSSMVDCYLSFVKSLPKVYVLSELEGLSDLEIADRLSLRLAAVKMRLHRARARLYKELRTHCRRYCNDRGELMGDLRTTPDPKRIKA